MILPEYAFYICIPLLTSGPLLETVFVNIIPTCSFTPDDLVAFQLEFGKTNWAIACDLLAVGWRGRRC